MTGLVKLLLLFQYLDLGRHSDALAAWRNSTTLKPSHLNAWTNSLILLDNLGTREREMFYLTTHSTHFIYGYMEGERNVLFNDALNTFYLRLYGVRQMVKDHKHSERGRPLPPHGLLFPISSKVFYICIIPPTG